MPFSPPSPGTKSSASPSRRSERRLEGSQAGGDIGPEAVDCAQDVIGNVQRRVIHQRREIHRERESARLIGAVRGEISGGREPPAGGGKIVALPSSDLRIEDADERGGNIRAGGDGQRHLFGIEEPVEVAPDLAAVDLARAGIGAYGA